MSHKSYESQSQAWSFFVTQRFYDREPSGALKAFWKAIENELSSDKVPIAKIEAALKGYPKVQSISPGHDVNLPRQFQTDSDISEKCLTPNPTTSGLNTANWFVRLSIRYAQYTPTNSLTVNICLFEFSRRSRQSVKKSFQSLDQEISSYRQDSNHCTKQSRQRRISSSKKISYCCTN